MELRTIVNPVTTECFEFIKTSADTNGEYIEFYQRLPANVSGFIPEHVHPDQEEYFEVLNGTATYSINGVEATAQAGEKIIVPAGVAHVNPYNNQDNAPLVLRRVVTPPQQTELFYRKICQLGNERKLTKQGKASLIQLAVFIHKTGTKTHFTASPVRKNVDRVVMGILGRLGSMMGYTHLP